MTKKRLLVHLFSLAAILGAFLSYIMYSLSLTMFTFDAEVPMKLDDINEIIDMTTSSSKTILLGIILVILVPNLYIFFFDKKSK